jgi:hypothetical protein
MEKEPKIVPDKLDNPINYKIIVLIIAAVVTTHVIVNFGLSNYDGETIISIIAIINPLASGIAGVFVGLRYAGTKVFQRAYVTLGMGYLCVAVGEMFYYIYDVIFDEPPFPSIADAFFLVFYPLIIIHLLVNIRFFAPKIPKVSTLAWLTILPIAITVFFVNVYGDLENGLEFAISIGYVIPAAVSLALTIYGTIIFKEGIIGKVWLILLFGVLSITFADIWYSYLEANDGFDLKHPVNVFWYAGYWIIVYSLYKHKQSI